MTPLHRSDGTPIPRVVLGTSSLGSVLPDALVPAASRERALSYLDGILETGGFALDIAASYQIGGTERVIGRWIESRRNRDQLYLITKGGHPTPVLEPHRLTPKALADDLHASLRRLRTERVDLYLLHRDDPTAPLESILESLLSFQRRGQIAAWGVSNWTHDRIRALDALARTAGSSVTASSPHFSLAEWARVPWKGCVSIAGGANREARAFYEATQIPVLAWSPLGRGFFSSSSPADGGVYGGSANVARRERVASLAVKRGVTPTQIALAYLFGQRFPVHAVVAASTPAKMANNLDAARLTLDPREIAWLESGDEAAADP